MRSDQAYERRFAFELETKNSEDIGMMLRSRGCLPSAESVATSHNDRRLSLKIASHALMLKKSSPRWWVAMQLPENPSDAWCEWRGRGRLWGGDTLRAVVQVEGILDELWALDQEDSVLPSKVQYFQLPCLVLKTGDPNSFRL